MIYHFAMMLTSAQLQTLVMTVQNRIEQLADCECRNPAVRLEQYAEMAQLRVVLEQLGGAA